MRKANKLTDKELILAKEWLTNGNDVKLAGEVAGYCRTDKAKIALNRREVQDFIASRRKWAVKRFDRSFDYARNKYLAIADVSIPDDHSELKELISTKVGQGSVSLGMTALDKINGMDGNHAPAKSVTVNISSTLDVVDQLREEYRREY